MTTRIHDVAKSYQLPNKHSKRGGVQAHANFLTKRLYKTQNIAQRSIINTSTASESGIGSDVMSGEGNKSDTMGLWDSGDT